MKWISSPDIAFQSEVSAFSFSFALKHLPKLSCVLMPLLSAPNVSSAAHLVLLAVQVGVQRVVNLTGH